MVAHPSADIGGKRPFGYSGEFELVVVRDKESGEKRYVIRRDKVFFDVTDHVVKALRRASGGLRLVMEFDDITRVTTDGDTE